ncbi:hypothetical protein GCM10023194_25080 [Planotetraspora phitsanulokensis]|uniref:Uncharacterized protein n=2 Tax=Planotetraspora phitsanulokensis TaxID=575192 RepID=A0A8J3UDM1_9ACTN|nr:hypothetical protein Pph01_85570 [Planotetraspora phitsanulokensis]
MMRGPMMRASDSGKLFLLFGALMHTLGLHLEEDLSGGCGDGGQVNGPLDALRRRVTEWVLVVVVHSTSFLIGV